MQDRSSRPAVGLHRFGSQRVVLGLLRSPLHRALDSRLLALQYLSRDGREITLPVEHVADGQALIVLMGDSRGNGGGGISGARNPFRCGGTEHGGPLSGESRQPTRPNSGPASSAIGNRDRDTESSGSGLRFHDHYHSAGQPHPETVPRFAG